MLCDSSTASLLHDLNNNNKNFFLPIDSIGDSSTNNTGAVRSKAT